MFETLSRPLPKKQISRLLIVDLAVILVLVVFPVRSGWLSYRDATDALLAQEALAEDYSLQIGEASQAERNRPLIIGEIRAATAALTRGMQSLRAPGEIAAIFEEIRDLTQRVGLENIAVIPGDLSPETGFQQHDMVISALGTYREHLNLIYALRNQSSPFIITTCTIRVEEEHTRTPQLRMTLGVRMILVEDLIPMEEINRLVTELAAGLPADSTAVDPGGTGDEGGTMPGEDGR